LFPAKHENEQLLLAAIVMRGGESKAKNLNAPWLFQHFIRWLLLFVHCVIVALRRLGGAALFFVVNCRCRRLGIAALAVVVVVHFGRVAIGTASSSLRRIVVVQRGFDFVVSSFRFANGLLPFFPRIWAEFGSAGGSVWRWRSEVIVRSLLLFR